MEYRIDSTTEGRRLDVWLAENAKPTLSRDQWLEVIRAGDITVNNTTSKAGYRLREGDQIMIHKSVP